MTQDKIPEEGGGGPAEGGPPPPTPVRGDPSVPAPLPTPVRSLMEPTSDGRDDVGAIPEPEGDATVEVGGEAWVVRVVGRSLGGPSAAPVPLLLLGFFSGPDGRAPQREALVVGRTLGDLSSEDLEAALGASREPPAPGERKPIFPEIVTKGNRRDG